MPVQQETDILMSEQALPLDKALIEEALYCLKKPPIAKPAGKRYRESLLGTGQYLTRHKALGHILQYLFLIDRLSAKAPGKFDQLMVQVRNPYLQR